MKPFIYLLCWLSYADSSYAADLPSLFLEDLTWQEAQEALSQGYDSVIIPTGGTEQNGVHMILGKHNYTVRFAAEGIAKQARHMLIAPVIAYVPEGNEAVNEGHMAFTGTISLREETFYRLLKDTAQSFRTHGFKMIYLLGDSGGNQAVQDALARSLTNEWKDSDVRVIHLSDYYNPDKDNELLARMGFAADDIGMHATISDTSQMMAIHPEGVREDLLEKRPSPATGATGSAIYATAEIGEKILQLKINRAVAQIKREAANP